MPVAIIGAAASAIGGIAAAGGIAGFTFLGLSGVGAVLARVAVSLVLSSLTQSLSAKPKKQAEAGGFAIESTNRTQQIRQPITARRYVYGEVRVSGTIVFGASTGDNEYLHLVVTLAAHEVESIDEVWLGDDIIPNDYLDGSGNVTQGKYSGKVRIKKHLGAADQVADSDLAAEVSEWTSAHRGRGVAYLYIRMKHDRDVFPTGAPNASAVVRGKKVYDHRDAQTRWSPNIALLTNDFMQDSKLGCRIATADIGTDEAEAAANSCEEIVQTQNLDISVLSLNTTTDIITLAGDFLTLQRGDRVQVTTTGTAPGGLSTGTDYYVIPYQFGETPRIKLAETLDEALAGTAIDITSSGNGSHKIRKTGEPRYFGGGTVDADAQRGDVIRDIMSGMGGTLVATGGYWKIFAAVWRAPTVTIDEGDSRGPMRLKTRVSRATRFNKVKGIYVNPANYWQPSDFPAVSDAAYVTADGEELISDLELPFTQRPYTAQRIAKIKLKKHRNEETIEHYGKMDNIRFQPTDTLRLNDTFLGYSASTFEITEWKLAVDDRNGVQTLGVDMSLASTAATDYDWDSTEEAAITDAARLSLPDPFTVTVVTGFSLDSELISTQSGDNTWKVTAEWDIHVNQFVASGGAYELEYKRAVESTYASAGKVDGTVTTMLVPQLAPDTPYDFRIYAFNSLGRRSAATEITGFVAGTTVTTDTENWEINTEAREPDDWESDSEASEDWEA